MSNLINRKAVKDLILQKTKADRPGWKCTRVSKSALDEIEIQLRLKIDKLVQAHPTIGHTFKQIF